MTERAASGRAAGAVSLLCLTAASCFGGAVTTAGLLLAVLPSVVVCGALASRLAVKGRPLAALAGGAVLGLALAQVANVLSGQTNGPTARSTAVATLMTVLAVTSLAHGPALFLLPVAGLVVAAMVLGAAGEVGVPVLATAALAVWVLAVTHRHSRHWVSRPSGRVAVAALLPIAVLAAAVAVLALQLVRDEPPGLQATGQLDRSIVPGGFFALPGQGADSAAREAPADPPDEALPPRVQPGGGGRQVGYPHSYRPPFPRLPW